MKAMEEELAARLESAENFADRMDVIRRFKHEHETRVGVKDVYTDAPAHEISAELTRLAQVLLEAAMWMCLEDVSAKFGRPKRLPGTRSGITVVGLGKLGGGELIYGSDLDIFFMFENMGRTTGERPLSSPEFYAKLSERLLFSLSSITREGFAFRTDARLRPGGSHGVLANTGDALAEYYAGQASVWEFQALTRARAVAGDKRLKERFEALRLETLCRPVDYGRLASEVRHMRMRLLNELGSKARGGVNIKHSRGGIVDIEFLVQFLQLRYGPESPELFVPYYPGSIGSLVERGLLPGGDWLPETYAFYRELESGMRVTTGQPDSILPNDPDRLERLAARMGYGGGSGGRLMKEYLERSAQVGELFEKLVPEDEG